MNKNTKPISEVYNTDCLSYMKSLPDKYFDLCIADPPYGIGIATNSFRQKHEKKDWDNQIPTQKPIALYAWILDNYAKQGDKIFDPFLGSGSSRIAAYKKGFDFYACELDTDYYEAQEERFKKECFGEIKQANGEIIRQLTLFQ